MQPPPLEVLEQLAAQVDEKAAQTQAHTPANGMPEPGFVHDGKFWTIRVFFNNGRNQEIRSPLRPMINDGMVVIAYGLEDDSGSWLSPLVSIQGIDVKRDLPAEERARAKKAAGDAHAQSILNKAKGSATEGRAKAPRPR